ncbi:MAG: hypothetical protein H7232_11105 [Aeromicrobium sp.]|nr:hypothetical protein [Burkholderiales bacterium]
MWLPGPMMNGGGCWGVYPVDVCDAEEAAKEGYRILGPVPSHAEVEALRAAHVNFVEWEGRWAQRVLVLSDDLNTANAEIARLKRPDLVTVRRSSLRDAVWAEIDLGYGPSLSFADHEKAVNARLTAMEDAAK